MQRILRYWPWGALALMACGILLMNVYCVPAFDELMYAFEGIRTPMNADVPSPRVASLMDIVRQQMADYHHPGANGRVWIHSVVACFAAFKLYLLFDILNTAMWFVLVWLVLREGRLPLRADGKTFLYGTVALWWLLWMAETCCCNAAFAVNYLWVATATVAVMMLWRRLTHWWMLPLFFFYGWSQEGFVLPMLAALAGSTVVRSLVERRCRLTFRQGLAWLLMLGGACFLCFAPSTRGRAGQQIDFGDIGAFIASSLHAQATIFLFLGSLFLAGGLGWVLWRKRGQLHELAMAHLEWWLFLLAAYALFSLLAGQGVMGLRIAMPALLAGCILLFRHAQYFVFPKAWSVSLLALGMAWFMGGVALQVSAGAEVMQMLRLYREHPSGVTTLPPAHLWVWAYSSYRSSVNSQDRMCWRREFGHPAHMIVLAPWLYENLFLAPQNFFTEAEELEACGLFVVKDFPMIVVKPGDNVLTPRQYACLKAYSDARKSLPFVGYKRYFPGRFRVMFPEEDSMMAIPKTGQTFKAANGERYTIFTTKGIE